nr:MAG TPA: hypothetical protein [Caudoviricetes sp.]
MRGFELIPDNSVHVTCNDFNITSYCPTIRSRSSILPVICSRHNVHNTTGSG